MPPIQEQRKLTKRKKPPRKPSAPAYKPPTVATKDTKADAEFKPAKKILKKRQTVQSQVKDTKGDADRNRGKAESQKVIREARINQIRKNRHALVSKHNLKKELEGRGVLAKGLSKAGSHAARNALPGSDVNRKLGVAPDKQTAGKVIKDLVNFPAQVIPSVYVPAAGAVEAAQGRPERIKRFAKDIDEHDPIFNLGAAGVEALKGNTGKAGERLERAKTSIDEHPGFALLEAAGVKGTVGRGAGRAMRSGAVGKKAKRIASTERPSRRLEGTNIEEKRTYSKDVFRKQEQKVVENVRRDRVKSLQRKADRAEGKGNVDRARELRHKAALNDPDRIPEHEIARRVDERVDLNEGVRRINRAKVTSEARKIVKPVRKKGAAVSLVAQRIVDGTPEDLRAYKAELAAEFPKLSNAGKRANKDLRRQIDEALKGDLDGVEEAAVKYHALRQPLDEKLIERGLLNREEAERSALIPGATRKGLRDADTPTMRKAVGKPTYLTQSPSQRGARNFFVSSNRPQQASKGPRTGEATLKGTFDADPETLIEGAARAQGLVDATDGFRGAMGEFAYRSQNNKVKAFGSHRRAVQAASELMNDADGNPIPGTVQWRAVRVNPFAGRAEQMKSLFEDVNSQAQGEHPSLVEAFADAIKGKDGEGPWVLIPETAAKRMEAHVNLLGSSEGKKALQVANSAFRRTVLSTSLPWMTGNIIEATGRMALAKAGPRSYALARKTLKELEAQNEKVATEAAVRAVSGGHFALADRGHMHRDASMFQDGRVLAPLARSLGAVFRAPGAKQGAQAWKAWTDFVFHTVNNSFESKVQTAMFGKALRDAGYRAADDAANGLKDTNNQVRFAREVDRMYGRYSKFGPSARQALVLYTPFAAWMVNAAFFVTRTLPSDHPLATAVIAASENATDEWRKEHGLDLFMEGAVPGWLQGSIPAGKGKLRLAKYTPFGAFGALSETASGQILPAWKGALNALNGKDWTGDKELRVGDRAANEPERWLLAAKALVESHVPIIGQAQRVVEKGPAALNPFVPVAPKSSTKSSGFKWSDGGSNFKWSDSSSEFKWPSD